MKNGKIRKNITTIDEGARRYMDITRDEYALCQYIQFRAADPRQRVPGRCCDPKESVADFIGITRPGLYKMLDRLAKIGLLDIDSATGAISVSPVWMDTMSVNKVDTLPEEAVNLVDRQCKQSLQSSVNKVTHNIEVKEEYSKSIVRSNNSANAPDYSTLKTEKEKKSPPVPAAPPAPVFNPDGWRHPEEAAQAVATWLQYKRSEKKGSYKAQKSFDIAVGQWLRMFGGCGRTLQESVNQSISNGWSGLFPVKVNRPAQAARATGIQAWDNDRPELQQKQAF